MQYNRPWGLGLDYIMIILATVEPELYSSSARAPTCTTRVRGARTHTCNIRALSARWLTALQCGTART